MILIDKELKGLFEFPLWNVLGLRGQSNQESSNLNLHYFLNLILKGDVLNLHYF